MYTSIIHSNRRSLSSLYLNLRNIHRIHDMAEPIGTSLAVIGLLGLVSTSLEFMEYVTLAKSQERDLERGLAQTALMDIRLSSWASALKMDDEDSRIPAATYHKLEAALSHLNADLGDVGKLNDKYGVSKVDSAEEPIKKVKGLKTIFRGVKKQSMKPSGTAKMWWAIHDKTKFDKLLVEIDRTLTHLEKITETIPWNSNTTVRAEQLQLYNRTKDDIKRESEEAGELLSDAEKSNEVIARSTGQLFTYSGQTAKSGAIMVTGNVGHGVAKYGGRWDNQEASGKGTIHIAGHVDGQIETTSFRAGSRR